MLKFIGKKTFTILSVFKDVAARKSSMQETAPISVSLNCSFVYIKKYTTNADSNIAYMNTSSDFSSMKLKIPMKTNLKMEPHKIFWGTWDFVLPDNYCTYDHKMNM